MRKQKITVSLYYDEWKAVLMQIGVPSKYYKPIKRQLPKTVSIENYSSRKKRLTKKEIKANSTKSVLTKTAEKYRENLIDNMTIHEKIALQGIKELKMRYALQKIFFYNESFYIADFYLPDYKLVIEIDGKQHYTEDGVKKDTIRTEVLQTLGVNAVVRIPNSKCTSLYVKSVIIEEVNKFIDYEIDKPQ